MTEVNRGVIASHVGEGGVVVTVAVADGSLGTGDPGAIFDERNFTPSRDGIGGFRSSLAIMPVGIGSGDVGRDWSRSDIDGRARSPPGTGEIIVESGIEKFH